MTDKRQETEWLEAHFDAARRRPETPSGDLMRRVQADAERAQSDGGAAPVATGSGTGRLGQFYRILGGWPAAAGLGTAAVAGLWLGVSPPAGLDAVAQGFLGAEDLSYLVDMSVEAAFGFEEGAM